MQRYEDEKRFFGTFSTILNYDKGEPGRRGNTVFFGPNDSSQDASLPFVVDGSMRYAKNPSNISARIDDFIVMNEGEICKLYSVASIPNSGTDEPVLAKELDSWEYSIDSAQTSKSSLVSHPNNLIISITPDTVQNMNIALFGTEYPSDASNYVDASGTLIESSVYTLDGKRYYKKDPIRNGACIDSSLTYVLTGTMKKLLVYIQTSDQKQLGDIRAEILFVSKSAEPIMYSESVDKGVSNVGSTRGTFGELIEYMTDSNQNMNFDNERLDTFSILLKNYEDGTSNSYSGRGVYVAESAINRAYSADYIQDIDVYDIEFDYTPFLIVYKRERFFSKVVYVKKLDLVKDLGVSSANIQVWYNDSSLDLPELKKANYTITNFRQIQ